MKRSLTTVVMVSLIACTTMWTAQTASADSYDGFACQAIDSRTVNGSTIVFIIPSDCNLRVVERLDGAPTISDVFGESGSGRLLWQQQVERATSESSCPDGWGATWAHWAKGGSGGPTCVRVVDWGAVPITSRIVSVTINTDDDWVELDSVSGGRNFIQWATGCTPDIDPTSFYPDRRNYGCPLL